MENVLIVYQKDSFSHFFCKHLSLWEDEVGKKGGTGERVGNVYHHVPQPIMGFVYIVIIIGWT